MKQLWRTAFNIFILLICLTSNAQTNNYEFTCIDSDKGLSNNSVTCITQDSTGLIWIGTEKGLNQYNGYTIKNYNHSSSDSNTIAANHISDILVTQDNRILITTHEGLSIYNPDYDNFENYTMLRKEKGYFMQNYMNAINQDKEGNIWIASTGGLYLFDIKNKTFTPYFNYSILVKFTAAMAIELQEKNIPKNVIEKIKSADNKFFNSQDELSLRIKQVIGEIDHKTYAKPIIEILIQNNDMFYSGSVNEFIFKDEFIWMGLSNGHIVRLNKVDKSYKVAYLSPKPEIETIIYSMFSEHNHIWAGSNSRSKIFDSQTWGILTSPKPHLAEILNMRDIVYFNTTGNTLWIGTNKGLIKYNKASDKYEKIKPNYFDQNSLNSELIAYIFIDQQENVWVGSKDAGICKLKKVKNFKKVVKTPSIKQPDVDNYVTATLIDNSGDTWIGYYSGGIDVYNTSSEIIRSYSANNKKIASGSITGLIQDNSGVIWASSYLNGLQKYNLQKDAFTPYVADVLLTDNLHIMQLICDKNDNLWLAGLGIGIIRIDKDRKSLHWLNQQDTLFGPAVGSNWVQFIHPNPSGGIIMSSENSLLTISHDAKKIERIWNSDISFKSKNICLFEDSVQNTYLGTSAGLFLIKTSNKTAKQFKSRPIIANYSITGIINDNFGNLWVSSNKGLFKITIDANEFIQGIEPQITQYKIDDGLPSNFFSEKTAFKAPSGKLIFGTKSGYTKFSPQEIKQDTFKPKVIITNFRLFNKTINPSNNGLLEKNISQTTNIELKHNQNFISFEFAALDFINADANDYAYMLEGVDETWNYIGNKREANYTNLNPGYYNFKVKASNHDKLWNSDEVQISLIIKPPFWKTNLAMLAYAIAFMIILWLFNYLIRYQEKFKSTMLLERVKAEKDNELNKMKLQFFTNISHEFRTPLTLIIGPLENLMQKNKDAKEYQLIYRNAKKLLGLIDQIMDIRKLNSGKMQLIKEECDVVGLIEKICTDFEYQSKSKQIKFYFEHKEQQLKTLIDPDKFETIINNLISNAFKHTPKDGNISILLNMQEVTKSNINSFSILVKDSGKGIPESDIDSVFERFYQSKNKNNDGGSGIGLNLVKELTEMHGGTVAVKSQKDIGSTFTLTFPVILEGTLDLSPQITKRTFDTKTITSEGPIEIPTPEHAEKEAYEKIDTELDDTLPLILVAEDNDEVREYIKSELKDAYRVIDVENGKDAYEAANINFPDIIISDVMMPEMDGIELSKRLKTEEKTSHIPIILLTAYNNENVNIAGYETGVESFLAKPFSPKVLKTRINNILQNRERLKEKFSNILYAVPSNKGVNNMDEDFIKKAIQIVEDNLIEEKFNIEFLCKEMGYSRTALYSKIKALTDQSISEFIKLIRLKKSIELFKVGQKSVNEVAFMVGFKTHSHFSRCFQEEFNMSPSDYLNKLKKDVGTKD